VYRPLGSRVGQTTNPVLQAESRVGRSADPRVAGRSGQHTQNPGRVKFGSYPYLKAPFRRASVRVTSTLLATARPEAQYMIHANRENPSGDSCETVAIDGRQVKYGVCWKDAPSCAGSLRFGRVPCVDAPTGLWTVLPCADAAGNDAGVCIEPSCKGMLVRGESEGSRMRGPCFGV
jgi:hypothetical protein